MNTEPKIIIETADGIVELIDVGSRSMLSATNRNPAKSDGVSKVFSLSQLNEAVSFAGIDERDIPKPKLRAMVCTPEAGIYQVDFEYVNLMRRVDRKLPSFSLPARDYDHAKAIAIAFNS